MDPAKEEKLFSTLSMIEKKLSAIESGSGSVRSSVSPIQERGLRPVLGLTYLRKIAIKTGNSNQKVVLKRAV